jgi:hypothetical protein
MMAEIRRAIRSALGRRNDVETVRQTANQLTEARSELRTTVSGLGQEVWRMVETGDALSALVHGARRSQFHREIESGEDE